MRIQFVTGTDAAMFPQVLILLQSCKEAGADQNIAVCDFGLTSSQRQFLHRRGQLCGRAPSLPRSRRHPWYFKSSLIDYLDNEFDAAVWFDADMLLTTDIRSTMSEIVSTMRDNGQAIAACPDTCSSSFEGFLRIWGDSQDLRSLHRLIAEWSPDLGRSYLNSGFFVVTSRRWLKDWKRITFSSDFYFLVDQNAFNVHAWRAPGRVHLLDARQWNVHGDLLGTVLVSPDRARVLCREQPAFVLHATSTGAHHEDWATDRLLMGWGGRRWPIQLKVFRHPQLNRIQIETLFRFVEENGSEMAKYLC